MNELQMKYEVLTKHIRERTDIDTEIWSIREVLKKYGMEMYQQLCCDRIADADKIDGEHVMIDWFEPGRNLVVDWKGFAKCGHILAGYIGEEEWDKLCEVFYDRQKRIDEQNNLLQFLRFMDKYKLEQMLQVSMKLQEESADMVRVWIKEEINARRFSNRVYQKMKQILRNFYIREKYFRQLLLVEKCQHGGMMDE